MDYQLEVFLIWPAFFVTIGLAMAFGFYGMANPKRNWQIEVVALVAALVFAGLCGLWISIIAGPSGTGEAVEIYSLVALVVMSGTLVGAIPRMLGQTWRSNHWSLGFLFRLLAYFALLVAVGRLVETRALIVLSTVCILAIGFYLALLGTSQGNQRGPLSVPHLCIAFICFPLLAYFLTVGAITSLEFYYSNDFLRNLQKAALPFQDAENIGQFAAVVAFLASTYAIHIFMAVMTRVNFGSSSPSQLLPPQTVPAPVTVNDDAIFE